MIERQCCFHNEQTAPSVICHSLMESVQKHTHHIIPCKGINSSAAGTGSFGAHVP